MSALRTAALAALAEHREAEARKAQEKARATAQAALERVQRSPLGTRFPEVVWHFVGELSDGITLVKEKGEKDGIVLGIKSTNPGDQGPDVWQVWVYKPGHAPDHWMRYELMRTAADVGDYIDRHEPKGSDQ